MRIFTRHILAGLILFMGFQIICAQPVDLGAASSFAVFSATGAFSNDGTTLVTGDIGTNAGAFSGFPPGIVIGSIHVVDAVSAQAATDVAIAYGQLSTFDCDQVLTTTLGNGQILSPGIYCTGAATTLDGDLILDGGCDPDAIFIFQIDGAFATTVLSNVILINAASLCNIYWQVNGAVTLGPSSVFQGNIVAGGAIHLLLGATLYGRAVTTAGAIDMHTNVVDRNMLPTASTIIALGVTTFCEGESVTLEGNCGGTWSTGESTSSIIVSESGDYFITTSNDCGSSISNHIIITVNPLPLCSITGDLSICTGQSTELCAGLGFTSYVWSSGEFTACITVNIAGTYTITITDINGCISSCSQTVTVSLPPTCAITGDLSICEGQSTTLCTTAGLSSYIWSTGAIINCITVNTAGIYTVTVTDANGCTSSCSQTVSVSLPPTCSITGDLSICEGQSTTLCTTAGLSSYIWSTGAIINCITVNTAGIYTVTVTDANGCTSSCSQTVSVSLPPACAITGDLSICEGQSTTLCTTAGLSSYIWSTGAIINCITVNTAGIYSVTVTDANGCTSSCSQTVSVSVPPTCAITGDLSICEGQSTTLCTTAGLSSYIWSTGAIINCITVNTAGIYTVTVTDANGCTSSCSQTVSVSLPPTCSITGDLSICEGQSTTLCTTAGLSSYIWSTGAIINCITVNTAGIYTVTVTDANGCTSSCSQTVSVSLPPACAITGDLSICEGQSTTLCTTAGLSSYIWSTGAIINCITVNTAGIYTVTVTDANGCTSSCSQTVIISIGNLPPAIICPINVSLECGENTLPSNTGTAIATDNCGGILPVDFDDDVQLGECLQAYTITRTWIAIDDNGNSISCNQTISVVDNTPPVITCATVISPIQCGSTPSFGTPTVLDACDATVTVTFSDVTLPGLCPQAFSVTRTWTATDDCGNSSQCSRTIVVQDNTAPVINCPVVVSPIQCGSTPSFGTPTVLDACDATVTVTFSDVTLPGLCPQAFSVTRTWTATDDCGNSSQCSRTIVVQDNTAPVINCPVVVSPIQCGSTPSFGTPTVLDACDATVTVTFSDITLPGLCPQAFSVTRTWTATDDCGNSSQCSQTIVVQDNTAPIITCPVVVSPIQCGSTPSFGTPIVLDACDATVTVTFSDITLPGLCPQAYSVTRTWTATDDCGNSSQCSRTIIVQDDTAPIITCPVVVSPIQCGSIPSFGTPTVLDACDATVTVIFSDVTLPGSCGQGYSVTRTWTATDDCGNSSQCSRTIVVQGSLPPEISCALVTSPIECGMVPLFGAPTIIESCNGEVVVTFSDVTIPGSCPQEYSVTRTWAATDDCGNSAQCSQTIVVQDNTAPIITCPVVISPIQCGSIPSFGTPTVLDACDATVAVIFSDLTLPGLCPQAYSVTRTWTATDDCGNSSQCSRTIVVQDNTAPVINCPVVVSPIQCGSTPSFGTPTVLDACDATVTVIFSDVTLPGLCPQAYSVTRTWTATDDCGNSAQCSQTIVVQDNTSPIITCPVVISPIQCGSIPSFGTPTVLDACDATVTVTFSDVTLPGLCPQAFSVTRTWTATDDCGNSSQCSRTIVVQDNTAPVINCPVVVSPIQCGSTPSFGTPTVLDACDATVTVTFSDITLPGLCPQAFSVTRTWTATDDCGNSSQCSRTIVVQDNTAPVINCPVVVSPIQCGSTPTFGTPTVLDACDATVTVTFSDVTLPGLCPQAFSVTRTWTATDDCGNSSQCSRTIIVQDNTAPIINCPVVVSPIQCGSAPSFGTPTVLDACDATVTVIFSDITLPGLCPQAYSVTRTWTATDDCGNSAQCSQTIVVQDNTSPIITCPLAVSPIQCGTIPSFGTPTVLDACDATVTVIFSDVTLPGLCPQSYSVTRTWTATDDCGNSAQCSQTIVVQDNTSPIIICPVVVSPIQCGSTPSFGTPTVLDACDATVTVIFSDITLPGLCPQAYSVTRTWTATDDCGNSAQCSQTIVVQDNTSPIITCPVVVSPIQCGSTPSFGTPTVLDACDATVTVIFSDITLPGLCPQAYSVTRTWTATDDCGNSAQCSQTIVVQDNTSPIITCPVVVSPIQCGTIPSFGTPTVLDACDATVTVIFSDITLPGLCPQAYSVTRTWTATDDCGNSAQCSRTIVVQDNTAPIITCPVVISPIECDALVVFGTASAIDACDALVEITFVTDSIPGSCENEYTLIRTWTATDDCGNASSCSATIIVQDTNPPAIILPPGFFNGDTLRVQCYGQDPAWDLPVFDENSVTATDACDGNITITFDEDLEDEGNCGVDGYINLYRFTWTATDACGNSSIAFAFLALVDTIAPVIFGVPADAVVNCNEIPQPPVLVYATDECLCACVIFFEETIINSTSGCQNNVVVVRSWTARDRCGNETIAQQSITLIDTAGPVIRILQPQIAAVQNGAILEYRCNTGGIPSFYDSLNVESVSSVPTCGGAPSMSFESHTIISNNCEFFGYVEQRTFHWTGIDQCGNETNFSIIVQLMDDEAPVIIGVPENMTCLGDPTLNDVEAIDNCGNASIRFWETEIVNPCGSGTAVRRTYEAFDDCGNITRDTVVLIPNDLTLPLMGFVNPILSELPGDEVLIVSCSANGSQYTNFGIQDVNAVDPCSAGLTINFAEQLITSGDCSHDGYVALLALIWTASDVCGNHSSQTILAQVIDTTGPVFINFKPVMSIGCQDAMPAILTSDNCGDIVVTTADSIVHGPCVFEYDIIREITATDPCGNVTTREQIIHVGNGGGPTILGVKEEVCDDLTIPVVTAYDACAGQFVDVIMEQDTIANACQDGLVIQRTWSATDACGHMTVIHQTIMLNDHTPPHILIPSYSVINRFIDHNHNLIFFSQGVLMDLLNALNSYSVFVNDDCEKDIELLFSIDTVFAVDCKLAGYAERRTYTWIATDICDNADTLSFTVDLMDDVPPVMNETPGDTIYICEPLPAVTEMLSSVPVQAATVVYTEIIEPGLHPGEFNVTRTWVATDSCQNTSTVVHHIIWIPESLIACDIVLPESVECNSHGVIISSEVSGGSGPYTYVWEIVGEKCFIQIGQGTPEILIYVGWSEVKIILTTTDRFGCVSMCMTTLNCTDPFNTFSSDDHFSDTENSIENNHPPFQTMWEKDGEELIQKLTTWPNPAREMMYLSFESAMGHPIEITMVNLLNQSVLRDKFTTQSGYNIHQLDVSRLPEGSYIMEVRTASEIKTKVIVVLKKN